MHKWSHSALLEPRVCILLHLATLTRTYDEFEKKVSSAGKNTSLYTHTLDKNGSLYDPAGTESWNMQIRYENNEINDASYE